MKKMGISKAEHEKWHREHGDRPRLTPKQHAQLMKRMGISKQEDEAWHKAHDAAGPKKQKTDAGLKPVNPFAIGGGFLAYCVKQGWLVQQRAGRGTKYLVNKKGQRALKKFGIET